MEKKPNLLHLLKYKHTNKNEITLLCEHWMFQKKKKCCQQVNNRWQL